MTNVIEWQTLIPRPIEGPDDAVAMIEQLGFCTWGPIPRLNFPNLADAMGETSLSVLDHTWYWKDDLHFERRLYYGKIIGGQPSFLAPDFLPIFIAALAGPGQEGERDHLQLFFDGRLSREGKTIYEYLDEHAAQPTRALRRGAHLNEKNMKTATERALMELQRRLLVCKVDLTGRTRGTYSYVWDLAERFWPEAFEAAAQTTPEVARERIRKQLHAFGIEPNAALEQRLFLWR
jgi:Winged helix DNA-binding domain